MPQKKSVSLYRRNLVQYPNQSSIEQTSATLYSQTEYNLRGNVLENKFFDSSGAINEHQIYQYNENGFLAREKYIAGDEETTEEKSYERDDKGLIMKEFKHYADGSFDTTIYHYDSQYRINSKITVDDEGEPETKEVFEYRNDQLLLHEVFDGEGNPVSREQFTVDEHGNTMEHLSWDAEDDQTIRTLITYNNAGRKSEEKMLDEDDNLLGKITYDEDAKGRLIKMTEQSGVKDLTTRYDYDDQGNIVLQVVEDDKGEEVLRIERSYNGNNELVHSLVFIDGEGRTLSQHYEVEVVYTYFSP